jgi:hypothetical protein
MKKIILVTLGALLFSSLAACGGNNLPTVGRSGTEPQPVTQPPTAPSSPKTEPVPSVTVDGGWEGQFTSGRTKLKFDMDLQENGRSLAGRFNIWIDGVGYQSLSLSGTRTGSRVTITVNYEDGSLSIMADLIENRLIGTMQIDGLSGVLTAGRSNSVSPLNVR